jgi:hypothetical protein
MFKEEFEKLAGYKVTRLDYFRIIEPMYMATKLNKEEFVKVINRKEFETTPEKEALDKIRLYAEEYRNNAKNDGKFFITKEFNIMVEEFARKYYDSNKIWIGAEHDILGCMYPSEFQIMNETNNRVLKTFKLLI